jgi:hypothetical protein
VRGQAHLLEAVVAGLLLVASVLFAIQMTAVTPLSASTSNQHIENQQRGMIQGMLAVAEEKNALKPAALFWNETESEFHDAGSRGYYTSSPPPNEFGRLIEETFSESGIAYNVYVVFQTNTGDQRRERMVYNGAPSDNAVSAGRSITLVNDDTVHDDTETITNSSFYANDVADETGFFNHVRVEVVVWRV